MFIIQFVWQWWPLTFAVQAVRRMHFNSECIKLINTDMILLTGQILIDGAWKYRILCNSHAAFNFREINIQYYGMQ